VQFLSDRLVHTNVSYYDIKAAGPTTLIHLGLWDPIYLNLEKEKRNIIYGKFCKEHNLTSLVYSVYTNFIKVTAAQVGAILITPDSLVSRQDPRKLTFVKCSCYDLEEKWRASILVATADRKNYIAINRMNNNKLIVKGPIGRYIPIGCIQKLLRFYQQGGHWIRTFRSYFKTAPVSHFITKENLIILENGVYEVGSQIEESITGLKVDKEKYWRIISSFIFSLYQSWR